MKRRSFGVGFATVSSSLAGCFSPVITEELRWKLRVIDVDERVNDGSISIKSTVGIDGNYGDDATVRSVRACFIDEQNELIGTASVDTVSADQATRNVSETVSREPAIIALSHGPVEGDGEFSVQGLRRLESDTYTVFTQEDDYC